MRSLLKLRDWTPTGPGTDRTPLLRVADAARVRLAGNVIEAWADKGLDRLSNLFDATPLQQLYASDSALERDLSIENNVRDLMQKIDRAIERMVAGSFGICDRCGKAIEKARVRALPYVDLCIKDARAQSRR